MKTKRLWRWLCVAPRHKNRDELRSVMQPFFFVMVLQWEHCWRYAAAETHAGEIWASDNKNSCVHPHPAYRMFSITASGSWDLDILAVNPSRCRCCGALSYIENSRGEERMKVTPISTGSESLGLKYLSRERIPARPLLCHSFTFSTSSRPHETLVCRRQRSGCTHARHAWLHMSVYVLVQAGGRSKAGGVNSSDRDFVKIIKIEGNSRRAQLYRLPVSFFFTLSP